MDIDFLQKKIIDTVREFYPSSYIDRITVGKNKLFIYGKTDDKWFKVIINKGSKKVRVYSPSKTIEIILRKRLEKYVENI